VGGKRYREAERDVWSSLGLGDYLHGMWERCLSKHADPPSDS
jgi:hypothetical protein